MSSGRWGRPAPRFPARLILGTPEHLLAFGFGAGLSPVAPGTIGTLVAVPVWGLLSLLPLAYFGGALAALIIAAVWICGTSARLLGVHDHPGIVFDEIAGFCIAATPLLPALGWVGQMLWAWVLAAFVLFRVFDIVKPWPIRWLDAHVHGGIGIVLDDVLAGIYAAAVLTGILHVL